MVFSPNHINVPISYLAAAGSKRIFTGANPNYTTDEVAYQMASVDAAVILVHPSLLQTAVSAAERAKIPLNRMFLFGEKQLQDSSIRDWRTLLAPRPDAVSWTWNPLDGDQSLTTIATINFSSGTTGLPKGVCITHHNLVANTVQTIFNKFYGIKQSAEHFDPE